MLGDTEMHFNRENNSECMNVAACKRVFDSRSFHNATGSTDSVTDGIFSSEINEKP